MYYYFICMNKPVEKKSVWLVILLSIVTLGIYVPYWLYQRLDAFNKLKSREKLDKTTITAVLVMYCFTTALYICTSIYELFYPGNLMVEKIDQVGSVIDFISSITMLYLTFMVRKIIEDHFTTKLSGVATFFFSIYYLQFRINKELSKPEQSESIKV